MADSNFAINTAGSAVTPRRFDASTLWVPDPPVDLALEVGSPWWWLNLLGKRLDARQPAIQRYTEYYDGAHRLAFATNKFREAFGSLFAAFADNWCRIVVDAAVERLRIEGFRFGDAGEEGDREAWDIWQANDLDAFSPMAHTEAVKCSEAAIIVDLGDDERYPRITVEHPSQVIVATEPGNPRRRVAALKRWMDDSGHLMATVWLPEAAYRFRSVGRVGQGQAPRWAEQPRVQFEVPNQFGGVVPVIPLRNNPSMLGGGTSDLDPAIPINDAVNKLCSDMLVASEYAAFRQRVMTGVEAPVDPVTGRPIDVDLQMGISRLITVADEKAKVYDLQASELGNYVKGIEMFVQHLAAQTRTPPHYLMGQVVNASGDALKAAETGLEMRVRRKLKDFSDPWEEALRLAFRLRGEAERADARDAETLWADPEKKSLGELVDAAVKMRTLGVPFESCWERIGATPQEIERWKTLAGLPDRPPPGATTTDVPPPSGGDQPA